MDLAAEKKPSEPMKVTDKRMFTVDGDLKDEFRETIQEREPVIEPSPPAAEPPKEQKSRPKRQRDQGEPAENPGTPFSAFLDSLIFNAYMSMGMVPNPYQPQSDVDPASAKQMIDIIQMLEEKTRGNLTEEESDYLETHLGELKLAWVRLNKTL